MRVNEFLDLVARETRAGLPPRLHAFRTWKRWTLIQFFYARRSIHYEVWVRGKEKVLELGLHCEADRATNSALLAIFDSHLLEIKDTLGGGIEAEQWTTSWTRVHELMPYAKLDPVTAQACGARLAEMIGVLQPILERDGKSRTTGRRTKAAIP
jgi:hypothetical protein